MCKKKKTAKQHQVYKHLKKAKCCYAKRGQSTDEEDNEPRHHKTQGASAFNTLFSYEGQNEDRNFPQTGGN